MKLCSLRADGRPHRTWTNVEATDEPWSFYIPAGSPVVEADGRVWSSPYPVVAHFFAGCFYQVFRLLKASGEEYYCNVITPPVWDASHTAVVFHDLDLDVYVAPDGVRVLDEEEFAAQQANYPAEWVTEARRAAAELVRMANAGEGVFSKAAARRWRAWVEARPS
ncbi:UPF0374 protein YgaC [Alicyclobacillus cellulosilyticus]|uniref:UPF0374 protein YgaC n=1 Tax=Alicyclobacillus cellulosilyticus TaxID=1003997 RepID=A0A917NJD7_9BACL|nr:DUF402 domain-containing protein [Alicyclobacillus cellulosilyticus]GGJ05689.1 UPF0374 protein YgaC [Alicyclobacillus cellulosilyticus]